MAQAAISLSVNSSVPADENLRALLALIKTASQIQLINTRLSIVEALRRIEERNSKDTRIETMKTEQEKEDLMKRYETATDQICNMEPVSGVSLNKRGGRGTEHPIIGYTAGVFDMFHVGHLNILKNAKQLCDYLIVAVSTDEVVEENKHKKPIIPFADRVRIVEAIRYVDKVVPQTAYDIEGKRQAAIDNHIHYMFVGDDWKGTEKWDIIEKTLDEVGVKVVYLPHTDGISSTMLREVLFA